MVEDLDRSLAFSVDLLGVALGHRSGPYAQLDAAFADLRDPDGHLVELAQDGVG